MNGNLLLVMGIVTCVSMVCITVATILAPDQAVLISSVGAMATLVLMHLFSMHKLNKLHDSTNSIVDKLVATTKSEAHAAGIKEEKDRPKPNA